MSKNPKTIFPKEVISFSVEELLHKRSKKSLIIYQLLLIILIGALISLPFISVIVSLNANGQVASRKLESNVSSSVSGVVEKVNVSLNQLVNKGDTLLTLDRTFLNEQLRSKEELIEKKEKEQKDLLRLTNTENNISAKPYFQTNKYQQEYQYLQSSLNELSARLNAKKTIYKREKALYDSKLSSDAAFQAAQLEVDLLINQMNTLENKFISQWNNNLQTIKFEISELNISKKQLLNQVQYYTLLATEKGFIKNLQGIKVGGFVFPNQTLAVISPSDDLVLECYLKPSDIGLIRQEQIVNIRVDAYNYQQWGIMTAEVSEIMNDIVLLNEQQPAFIVRCTP